jgi:hypothetical protein
MSTDQVHALTSDHIAGMTAADFNAMTTVQFQALTTSDMHAMTTVQFAGLDTLHISALTTDHIQALTTMDVAALTTVQMPAFSTDQLHAFTTDQVMAFETADLHAMTMAQSAHAFTSDQFGVLSNAQLEALPSASPLMLDLNGDGVHTLSASQGVNFDLNATGHSSTVGWAGKNDGLLVLDRNGDGVINDGRELFGSATHTAGGAKAGDGFTALSALDTNHDGKITAADQQFAELKVWVDTNSDGKSTAAELHALKDLGIIELNLAATNSTAMDNGNLLGLVSSYKTADGKSHQMADVWFAKQDGSAASATQATASTDATATDGTAHAATPAVAGNGLGGLTAKDLLADRGTDLMGGSGDSSHHATATTPAADGTATPASYHTVDTSHLSGLHGLLGEDPNKNILI